jgi:hypothetical protein
MVCLLLHFEKRVLTVGLVLALGLAGHLTAYADDDNNRSRADQSTNEVDCEDRDNAALPECKVFVPASESAPVNTPSDSQESSAPAPADSQPASKPSATSTPTGESKPAQLTGSSASSSITTDPTTILVTDDEAGKQATVVLNTAKDEPPARWAQRRYERERLNADVNTGPIVIDNQVWIARDVATAQSIFKEQTDWNQSFPEATDLRKGSFDFKIAKLGDETSSIGACDDCSANREYNKHFRVVFRKGTAVTVLYLYGLQPVLPDSLVLWYSKNVLGRMP